MFHTRDIYYTAWSRKAAHGICTVAALFVAVLTTVLLVFRWVPPPTTMFMVLEKVQLLRESVPDKTIHYDWVPYTRIHANMALAVIAAEDQTFREHWGFDVLSMKKVLQDHGRGKRLRGASTISQQTAKNLFLWPGRSYVRKAVEAFVTVMMETLWSKRRILEVYVNTAQMGPHIFGVGAASRIYFDTTPDRLSKRQAALLAAVLPNPRRFSAVKPSPYVQRRAAWILRQMELLGGLSAVNSLWHDDRDAEPLERTAIGLTNAPANAFVPGPLPPVLFPEPFDAPSVHQAVAPTGLPGSRPSRRFAASPADGA